MPDALKTKGPLVAAYGAFGASLVHTLWILWYRLNIQQIDLSGHAASALAFWRAGYHRFHDAFFAGIIQNLFYPPLEDALLGALLMALPVRLGMQIWLTALLFLFFGAATWTGRALHSAKAHAIWILVFVLVFNLNKHDLMYFQGLGRIDLTITGLTSQFIGGAAWIVLVGELMNKKRTVVVALVIALCLLSHLVCAAVAVATILIFAWSQGNTNGLKGVAWGLGLAAFFWIPFAAHKGSITTSNIWGAQPVALNWLILMGGMAAFDDDRARPLFATACLLVAPSAVGGMLVGWGVPLPSFHWYRFCVFALLLFGMAVGVAWTRTWTGWNRWLLWATTIGGVAYGVHSHKLAKVNIDDDAYIPETIVADLPPATDHRMLVVEHRRPTDFGLGSLLYAEDERRRFVKGLFWESGTHNDLMSSYIATILGPPVVLDYYHYWGYDCDIRRCILDHMVDTWGADRIVLPDKLPPYLTRDEKECIGGIARTQTMGKRTLTPSGTIRATRRPYTVYDLDPPPPLVDIVDPDQVVPLKEVLKDSMVTLYGMCEDGESQRPLLMPPEVAETLEFPPPSAGASGSLRKIDTSTYEVHVDSDEPVGFEIKLGAFPGWNLAATDGVLQGAVSTRPNIVGVGHGTMRLTYERTPAMWLGYAVSAVTWPAFAWLGLRRRKERAGSEE